jgi:hypothetical protein
MRTVTPPAAVAWVLVVWAAYIALTTLAVMAVILA